MSVTKFLERITFQQVIFFGHSKCGTNEAKNEETADRSVAPVGEFCLGVVINVITDLYCRPLKLPKLVRVTVAVTCHSNKVCHPILTKKSLLLKT